MPRSPYPRAVALLAASLLLTSPAAAEDWGAFEDAFPARPCGDGWAACIVDGERVTPDMAADGPVDLRVGWLDLRPSSSFSPFAGLTEYTEVHERSPEPVVVPQRTAPRPRPLAVAPVVAPVEDTDAVVVVRATPR